VSTGARGVLRSPALEEAVDKVRRGQVAGSPRHHVHVRLRYNLSQGRDSKKGGSTLEFERGRSKRNRRPGAIQDARRKPGSACAGKQQCHQ